MIPGDLNLPLRLKPQVGDVLGKLTAALVLQKKTAIGVLQIPKSACGSHNQVEEVGQRQISSDALAYPGSAVLGRA